MRHHCLIYVVFALTSLLNPAAIIPGYDLRNLVLAGLIGTAKVQFVTADNAHEIIMAIHLYFALNQPTDKHGQHMHEASHRATQKISQTHS